MDPLAPHGQGNIDAVIDQKRNSEPLGDLVKLPAQVDECACVEGLFPQLDDGGAAEKGVFDMGNERAARREEARVGDEVEREIEEWLWHFSRSAAVGLYF